MATTLKLNEATEVLVSFDQWRMGVSETYYGALSTRLIECVIRKYVMSLIREGQGMEFPDNEESSD